MAQKLNFPATNMISLKTMLSTTIAAFSLVAFLTSQAQAQDEEQDPPPSRAWIDSVDWNGDFRLRYEGIDEGGEENRSRFRFRGRLALAAELSNRVQLEARLATSDGDPVSTNLDFGDGFSSKNIAIDRLFVNWHALNNVDVALGKMGRPWFRAGGNSLLWDSDLNPEGALARWSSGIFFANLGTFVVAERAESEDSWLQSFQAGLDKRFSERSRLLFSTAYFNYTNTVGNPPFYRGRAKGNSVDAAGNLLYDYNILEVSAEYSGVIKNWPFAAYGVWARNTAVDIQDTAYAIGFRFGFADAPGKAHFSYTWHDTEADAVMGIFTDSDFGGGNTDSRGHFIKARYGLTRNIALNATIIISEIEMFRNNQHDYNRVQLDIEFLFD